MQDLLDPRYIVSMAMSPKGKNLVNKAYRSTRNTSSNLEEDSTRDESDLLIDIEELAVNETLPGNDDEEQSFNYSTQANLSREILEFRSLLYEASTNQSGVTQYGKNTNVRISNQ